MFAIKIIIVTPKTTPRLQYVLDFVFREYFNVAFKLQKSVSEEFIGPIIYYSSDTYLNTESSLNIVPTGILENQNQKNTDYILSLDQPIKINKDSNRLNYDLFSDIFYCLTRIEEYEFVSNDPHNRFCANQSQLTKLGLLETPIIDQRMLELGEIISHHYGIKLKRNKSYQFIHTIDVDQFFAYRNKSLARIIGGGIKNFSKEELESRLNFIKKKEDPFDTFDRLWEGLRTTEKYAFILNGNYGGYDLGSNLYNKNTNQTLQFISSKATIGIHPSIKSNSSIDTLKYELTQLENLMDHPIKFSRQHFLKLEFPHTYQNLISLGIEEDFSLGYHDCIGFRAGTSIPFFWYDLGNESITNLKIKPLHAMDVTLRKYMNLDPKEAIQRLTQIINKCKQVKGSFCLLWHNSSFTDHHGWKGWDLVYKEALELAQS